MLFANLPIFNTNENITKYVKCNKKAQDLRYLNFLNRTYVYLSI